LRKELENVEAKYEAIIDKETMVTEDYLARIIHLEEVYVKEKEKTSFLETRVQGLTKQNSTLEG